MSEVKTLLRNSERASFKTCRFRWALAYGGVWEIGPIRAREPAKALWFGDLIHQALAAYYKKGSKRGPKPAGTFLRLYDADPIASGVMKNDEGEWESLRDLGEGMLKSYVERFAPRDEEWEVISSEQTFQLPIKINGRVAFWVVGTFDGLWKHRIDKGRVAFKEFKTASSIRLEGLAMDEQAGFYWTYGPRWLWQKGYLKKGDYPSEILYTFLRKAIRNPDWTYDEEGRKLNQPTKKELEEFGEDYPGSISKSQPAAFFERQPVYRDKADREHVHERVLAEIREHEEARADPSRVYKNPGPLHNPNCAGCAFRDPCELHETGGDWRPMLDATTESWDPYDAHEIIERR